MKKAVEMLEYESEYARQGYCAICGADEVGRGPLAGPVTCAAVIMPLDDLIEGVNDSKKVAKKKRERLAELIKEKAVAYSVASYDNRKIDEMNILAATKACMAEAVAGLAVTPDVVIVDALTLDIPVRTFGIVHGDAQSYSIAAASILAKVERDAYMTGMDEVYPGYGFSSNAGYGTAAHIAALKELGPTPIHRRTFIGHFVDADE